MSNVGGMMTCDIPYIMWHMWYNLSDDVVSHSLTLVHHIVYVVCRTIYIMTYLNVICNVCIAHMKYQYIYCDTNDVSFHISYLVSCISYIIDRMSYKNMCGILYHIIWHMRYHILCDVRSLYIHHIVFVNVRGCTVPIAASVLWLLL